MIERTSEKNSAKKQKRKKKMCATHENRPNENTEKEGNEKKHKKEWKGDERIFFNKNHVHSFSGSIFIEEAFIFKFIIFVFVPSKFRRVARRTFGTFWCFSLKMGMVVTSKLRAMKQSVAMIYWYKIGNASSYIPANDIEFLHEISVCHCVNVNKIVK